MKTHSYPFRSLAIKDLLDARDAYHVHLANLENVVGTAIGLYRIRKEDPDAAAPTEETVKPKTRTKSKANTPRTMATRNKPGWCSAPICQTLLQIGVREYRPASQVRLFNNGIIADRRRGISEAALFEDWVTLELRPHSWCVAFPSCGVQRRGHQ